MLSRTEFVNNNLILIATLCLPFFFIGYVFIITTINHWGLGEEIKTIIKETDCDSLQFNYFYLEYQKPKYLNNPDYKDILKTLNNKITSCGLKDGSES